jgi:hypothetical protein
MTDDDKENLKKDLRENNKMEDKKTQKIKTRKFGEFVYELYRIVNSKEEAEKVKKYILEKTPFDIKYRKEGRRYYVYVSQTPRWAIKGVL